MTSAVAHDRVERLDRGGILRQREARDAQVVARRESPAYRSDAPSDTSTEAPSLGRARPFRDGPRRGTSKRPRSRRARESPDKTPRAKARLHRACPRAGAPSRAPNVLPSAFPPPGATHRRTRRVAASTRRPLHGLRRLRSPGSRCPASSGRRIRAAGARRSTVPRGTPQGTSTSKVRACVTPALHGTRARQPPMPALVMTPDGVRFERAFHSTPRGRRRRACSCSRESARPTSRS
jgi:hypothetical protein